MNMSVCVETMSSPFISKLTSLYVCMSSVVEWLLVFLMIAMNTICMYEYKVCSLLYEYVCNSFEYYDAVCLIDEYLYVTCMNISVHERWYICMLYELKPMCVQSTRFCRRERISETDSQTGKRECRWGWEEKMKRKKRG